MGKKSWTQWWLPAALVTAAVGCGSASQETVGKNGTLVGGPCQSQDSCDTGALCKTEGDFPGGMCVVPCGNHADCPSGARCTSSESGICLPSCSSASDCRSGYVCREKSDQSGGGKSLVCEHG
ncbi:MAG: hypothetical protein IT384_02715 [Deltaproteobacteria bacterium]|nr:hypothetical protein [Deltaproteobacteria bacterium]